MDKNIFTATIDWLAFTVPQATVEEIGPAIGGEWFETMTGLSWLSHLLADQPKPSRGIHGIESSSRGGVCDGIDGDPSEEVPYIQALKMEPAIRIEQNNLSSVRP